MALACAVFAGLFVPFVDMPFHIDDVAFLRLARTLPLDPLAAESAPLAYMGRVIPGFLPYESTHPLAVPYLLAGLVRLFGEREVPLHLAFFCFPALALVAYGRLEQAIFPSRAAGRWPIAVLLLATAPAFLVNAHTVMTDVPTLALALAGAACYLRFLEHGRTREGVVAALSLSASFFCSYQAGVYIALLGLLAGLRRKLSVRSVLPLAMPVLAMGVWLALVFRAHGLLPLAVSRIQGHGSIAGEVRRGLLLGNLVGKLASLSANIGLAALLPLFWRRLTERALLREIVALFAISAPVHAALWLRQGWPALRAATLALPLSACARALLVIADDLWRGAARERWFLAAWVAVVVAYNIALLPFGAARYMLPAVPPLILLLVHPPRGNAASGTPRAWLVAILALAVGGICSASDYEHAAAYRDFATRARAFRDGLGRPADIWYVGEWGMRHYMDGAGMRYLLADSNEARAGDLVVIPEMPRLWSPAPALAARLRPLGAREYPALLPLRLFNRRSGAGFYAHHWGLLPFAFSRVPVEWFEIYEVAR